MTAHVLIDAGPSGRGAANITFQDCGGFDLTAVADCLELYASERPVPLLRHHEPFRQNGVETPPGHRVMLCLLEGDGAVTLHAYGPELGEYYARGAAAYLRAQAMMPQMQQAAMQALAAIEAAKAQAEAMAKAQGPNGEKLSDIARQIMRTY